MATGGGAYDPITGNEVDRSKAYAEVDGLVFESLQTQTMYYQLLEKGFEVSWKDGKPSLQSTAPKVIWELRDKKRTNQLGCRVTKGKPIEQLFGDLRPGKYTLEVSISGAKTSTYSAKMKHTSARSASAEVIIATFSGNEILHRSVDLSTGYPQQVILFEVTEDIVPARCMVKLYGRTMFKKVTLNATLSLVPFSAAQISHATALRKTKEILQPGEFVVELTKGAKGVGMTLGWDKQRRGVVVKELLPNGAASRTRLIRRGDMIKGIQGVRVDGRSFKRVVRRLRNVPRTVVFVMERAPEGYQHIAASRHTRRVSEVPKHHRASPEKKPQKAFASHQWKSFSKPSQE